MCLKVSFGNIHFRETVAAVRALHDDGSTFIHGDIFIGILRREQSPEIMCYRLADQAFVKMFHCIEQFDASPVPAHLEVKSSDTELVDYGSGDDSVHPFDHAYSRKRGVFVCYGHGVAGGFIIAEREKVGRFCCVGPFGRSGHFDGW